MNILILTGSFGMGHISTANAIAEKILSENKNAKIYIEDLFLKTFKSKQYNLPFHIMINYGKCLYNYVYRNTADMDIIKKLPLNTYLIHVLQGLIDKSNADMIISTLPICSKLVSEYKRKTGSKIPLITCITDVSSHCEWLQPYTDFYLIATPQLNDELIRKGLDPQRIIVSGIPVRKEFKKAEDKPAARKEKKLLIMGGGLGLIPKTKNFYEAINQLKGVKTTVITGNNTKLYKSIAGKYENIEVLGFVKDVPTYMNNADLLISKPGGITIFEAISIELPLLIIPPFLQQEFKNSEFILDNHMGDILPDDRKLWVAKIQDMLNNDGDRNRIMENMKVFKTILDENALLRLIRQYEWQCA